MHRPQNRTAALLAAFGSALAYLPAGRALAAVCAALPLSAAGQSFALHCAAAPLAEELVFRGAVQRLLQPLGPRAAVCVQAALFAVQHGGAAGIAYALVLGVLLGTIRQRTGRVWPGWAGWWWAACDTPLKGRSIRWGSCRCRHAARCRPPASRSGGSRSRPAVLPRRAGCRTQNR